MKKNVRRGKYAVATLDCFCRLALLVLVVIAARSLQADTTYYTLGVDETSKTLNAIGNKLCWTNEADMKDVVKGYFAIRKFDKRKDANGVLRFYLNNKPCFIYGPLDQGWWPDGFLTPPSDEAMEFDIKTIKALGCNMMRKHIKVEPARYYYLCDKLGILLIQDMTSGWGNPLQRYGFFRKEFKDVVDTLRVFPSIVMWCPYNEGWGQPGPFQTHTTLDWVKRYDPSRPRFLSTLQRKKYCAKSQNKDTPTAQRSYGIIVEMFRKEKTLKFIASCSAFVGMGVAFFGCMTPEKAVRDTDETAIALATAYWNEQTGTTNSFDISRPADVLTLRIALEAVRQGITNTVFPKITGVDSLQPSNGITYLSLKDALRIGARNNRKYQTTKEDVYQKAIQLDTERYEFETTFSGFLLGALAGEPELYRESTEAGVGAKRKFENGSTIAGNLAVDVVDMVRDDWHSFGLSGDLTVTIPLLRGSAREIVREPLTQAERDLAYALLTFERYRQTYALSVIEGYYNVLEYAQNRRNSGDNARRLEQNWLRAEMMFKAGRMDRIQVDQARTDLLGARQSIITTQQSYENALDNFKITLGLAPEAPIALHDAELIKLEKEMESLAKNVKDALSAYPSENEAMNIALTERRDLAVTRGDVADSERKLAVAADALRADVSLEGGGSIDERRRSGESWDGTEDTFARLRFTAPWDRRRERNAYRKSLIALDRSRRTLEESEDSVKNQVRSGYRSLVAARALYENKVEAWKVAKIRVESNDLFMQSGRSSMRDILEAESALLSARNALCSSIIDWKMCDLSLKNSMGVFTVNSDGVWE